MHHRAMRMSWCSMFMTSTGSKPLFQCIIWPFCSLHICSGSSHHIPLWWCEGWGTFWSCDVCCAHHITATLEKGFVEGQGLWKEALHSLNSMHLTFTYLHLANFTFSCMSFIISSVFVASCVCCPGMFPHLTKSTLISRTPKHMQYSLFPSTTVSFISHLFNISGETALHLLWASGCPGETSEEDCATTCGSMKKDTYHTGNWSKQLISDITEEHVASKAV